MSFGGTPSIAPQPSAPTSSQADLEAQKAKKKKQEELLRRQSFGATILTGEKGITENNPTGTKTILGQ
jgi:hypothetical protein